MSNEHKDWLYDQEQDKGENSLKNTRKKIVSATAECIIMDEVDVCDDCHGGFNSLGEHLDCRNCNNTGVKPKPKGA